MLKWVMMQFPTMDVSYGVVDGWKPLTIIAKRSILDVAAVLDPPLVDMYISTLSLFLSSIV